VPACRPAAKGQLTIDPTLARLPVRNVASAVEDGILTTNPALQLGRRRRKRADSIRTTGAAEEHPRHVRRSSSQRSSMRRRPRSPVANSDFVGGGEGAGKEKALVSKGLKKSWRADSNRGPADYEYT
jgi:hypothetical protein